MESLEYNQIEELNIDIIETRIRGLIATFEHKCLPDPQNKIRWNSTLIDFYMISNLLDSFIKPDYDPEALYLNIKKITSREIGLFILKINKSLNDAFTEILISNSLIDISSIFQNLVESYIADLLGNSVALTRYKNSDEANFEHYERLVSVYKTILQKALARILFKYDFDKLDFSKLIASQESIITPSSFDKQVQEATELLFSTAATMPNIHVANTIFNRTKDTILPGNIALTHPNINWEKIALIYNQLVPELITDNLSKSNNRNITNINESDSNELLLILHKRILDKLYNISPQNINQDSDTEINATKPFIDFKNTSTKKDVEIINPDNFITDSKLGLSSIEIQILCKLIIFEFINIAKDAGQEVVNINQIAEIMKDFGLSLDQVLQHYALCTKPEPDRKSEEVESVEKKLILSEIDIAVHKLEGPNAADHLVEIFLPPKFGRLSIHSDTDAIYRRQLEETGFLKAITDIVKGIENIESYGEVVIELVFYDGSGYFKQTDETKVGVSIDLPTIETDLILVDGGKPIKVKIKGRSFDHHPREKGIKAEIACATAQVFEHSNQLELCNPNPDTLKIIVSVAEAKAALDTDLAGAYALLSSRLRDTAWWNANQKYIGFLVQLIDKIDRAAGAPDLDQSKIAQYLCLPLLFFPLSTQITVDRDLADKFDLKDILNKDAVFFKAFVDFTSEKFPEVISLDQLLTKFYENLRINMQSLFGFYVDAGISDDDIGEVSGFFMEQYKSILSAEQSIRDVTIRIPNQKSIKIAVVKYPEPGSHLIGAPKSPVTTGTIAYIRAAGYKIYLLPKSGIDSENPKEHNYTVGMLFRESNQETETPQEIDTPQEIENTSMVKELYTDYLSECWSYFRSLPFVRQFIQGDDTIGGTRTMGSGTLDYNDNFRLTQIFEKVLNKMLEEGVDLKLITSKAIFIRSMVLDNGEPNKTNIDTYKDIMTKNSDLQKIRLEKTKLARALQLQI